MAAAQRRVTRTLYCYALKLIPKPDVGVYSWREMFGAFLGLKRENMWELHDGSYLLLVVESMDNNEVKGHFSRLRYESPRVIDVALGREWHIDLKPDEHLIERAHFKYFPDKNVFIAEYNHYGVRAFGRFGAYVKDNVDAVQECDLIPFVRTDALERAARSRGAYRKVAISVMPPALPVLEEVFGLGVGEVFGALNNLDTELRVHIVVTAGRRALPSTTQSKIGALVERFKRQRADQFGFTTAKVTADEVIDLLGSDYYRKVSVLATDQNSRVVQSEDMYRLIDEFYENYVKHDLPKLTIAE